MDQPLVSVICLCYNQQKFVEEAIQSVLTQTYASIELIVVDDTSTDDSVNVIRSIIQNYPAVQFLALSKNVGNCKAFNKGLLMAKGDYVIDLAADDVLLPNRVAEGVRILREKGDAYGVHFSDAEIINESGTKLHVHSDRFPHPAIPQGDIYREVIQRYFICPPTVMYTRKMIDVLGGYDETLTYEDFDVWVRSSRIFKYVYSPEVLVKRRVSENALGFRQFKFFNKHSASTYKVCEKILRLNSDASEQKALQKRIVYEITLNVRLLNLKSAFRFFLLLIRNARKRY